MDGDDIERTAVIGAGEMGRGIAAVTALSGYGVAICGVDPAKLDAACEHVEWSYDRSVERGVTSREDAEAALDRIGTTTDLPAAASEATFVTEAAAER